MDYVWTLVQTLSWREKVCAVSAMWPFAEKYVAMVLEEYKERVQKMKKVIAVVSLVLIISGLGCTAMSRYVTWAEIDRDAVKYAIDAGVVDVNDYDDWWTNIVMLERLERDVDGGHKIVQLNLKQLIQKDDLEYSIVKDTVSSDLAVAFQREKLLFGETGLLSLGLSMAGFGGLTGLLGLMRKRPGDITAPEMEQALISATGKTSAELSAKEKQFFQLVNGIKVFMNNYKNSTDNKDIVVMKALKDAMNAKQDADTQAAVAVIKKTS